MPKEIRIPYRKPGDNSEDQLIALTYTIEREDNAIAINCDIPSLAQLKHAAQARYRFRLRALLEDKAYVLLFDYDNVVKAEDVSQFINDAYVAIMNKEKLPVQAVDMEQLV